MLMSKSAQKGIVDPKIIIGGIIVLIVVFFLATGNFKFSASVKNPDKSAPSVTQETTPAPTSKPKTYQNKKNNISLEYPDSWTLKENPAAGYIAGFYSPRESANDTYSENLGVKAVDTSTQPKITLQEVADAWENQTKKTESTFAIVDRKSSTIAGEDARDIVYTFTEEGNSEKGITRITLKNEKAYIFQYSALEKTYDKYLPDIEAILTSVKL